MMTPIPHTYTTRQAKKRAWMPPTRGTGFTNRRKRNWRHVKEDDELGGAAKQNEPASNGGASSWEMAVAPPPAEAHAAEAKRLRAASTAP